MQVDFLEEPISAFVRLSGPLPLGDLTEVSLETRFQKSSLSIISQRKEVKRDTLQINHGNNVVSLAGSSSSYSDRRARCKVTMRVGELWRQALPTR